MVKQYLSKLYIQAACLNDENVISAIRSTGTHDVLLDVGCWDGEKTLSYMKAAKASEVHGIEPVVEEALKAQRKNIRVSSILADKDPWPYPDNHFDCVVSNQVVEHLTDIDRFFHESARVLKKGGILITSTNNLSSLHNIIALMLGWAPFDLSNSSYKCWSIGNPFSLHRNELLTERGSSWIHKCVYNIKWLSDWQLIYGLQVTGTYGAGLYPLPAKFGRMLKRYSAFITLVGKKI